MSTAALDYLRKKILLKCKLENLNDDHCKKISIRIFEENGTYLSQCNIKKFFRLAAPPTEFSPFLLNSLAQFIGFTDWDEIKQKKKITI